jgi:hypothetical protein
MLGPVYRLSYVKMDFNPNCPLYGITSALEAFRRWLGCVVSYHNWCKLTMHAEKSLACWLAEDVSVLNLKSATILNQKAASRSHSSSRLRAATGAHTPRPTAQDSRVLLPAIAMLMIFASRNHSSCDERHMSRGSRRHDSGPTELARASPAIWWYLLLSTPEISFWDLSR